MSDRFIVRWFCAWVVPSSCARSARQLYRKMIKLNCEARSVAENFGRWPQSDLDLVGEEEVELEKSERSRGETKTKADKLPRGDLLAYRIWQDAASDIFSTGELVTQQD